MCKPDVRGGISGESGSAHSFGSDREAEKTGGPDIVRLPDQVHKNDLTNALSMKTAAELRTRVAQVGADFDDLALEVFRYQAVHNSTYRSYLRLIGRQMEEVQAVSDIPFLPIQFFKSLEVRSGDWTAKETFTSSGTTGATTARHPVRDTNFYLKNTERCFELAYGRSPQEFCWLALLPSYLERSGSSLILMAEHFIRHSRYGESGFFLYDHHALIDRLRHCREQKIPTVLLGVSFALLDLAERHPTDLSGVLIMETGGMKGRRREMTRGELHTIFRERFRVGEIHSEYGMTELFSQAYSRGDGRFEARGPMRVQLRDPTDPLGQYAAGRTGALNIIDLANVDTVSFIATDDLGRVFADGSFEVLGRMDASDARGCNLLLYEV